MRWRKVDNPDVIDQRGASSGGAGGFPIPMGRAGGGVGLIGIIIFLLIQFLGGGGGGFSVNPGFNDQQPVPGSDDAQGIPASQDPEKDLKDFSAYVFTNVQDTWQQTFKEENKPYQHAKLVLYRGGVNTGCGSASSAVGPFYCPEDQRVYLDLSFYKDMADQLGASGDFAWAYVIGHEMGHHVQEQSGTSSAVQRKSQQNPDDANALSVRTELQADCYSGVWAKTVFAAGDLEQGDVDEAMNASRAVGDDRLQSRGGGSIDPDSFTHGTSAQRSKWFATGYKSGDPASCDTFSVDSP